MRMFAGPNGSGKSTLKSILRPDLIGIYINPDEILQQNSLNLNQFEINTTIDELKIFILNSSLVNKISLPKDNDFVSLDGGKLIFHNITINSYLASILSDFLRNQLLCQSISFTFETVTSSRDKVKFLQKASNYGYRTYLYYVATEDPAINISRVANRVSIGGHNVPEDKIISCYYRSLDYLLDAVSNTSRAYIFDNSDYQYYWLAEIIQGCDLQIKTNKIPAWFKKNLWDKMLPLEGN